MRTKIFLYGFMMIFLWISCKKEYTPKPRGYFRIDFPEKSYHQLDLNLPYTFQIPVYSEAALDSGKFSEPGWINIKVPENKAELHISYADLDNNLLTHLEESHRLAYKHSIKADAINEQLFINKDDKVYGTIYLINGNAASPIQFYLTDSTKHFLRGALYISEVPNIDSIRPVINFLKPDVIKLIETTKWTN